MAKAKDKTGAAVIAFSMPTEVARAVRDNANARYETQSQWFRNIVVPILQRRGALPKQ